jgi:ABC-2 type transport system permease protein
MMQDILTVMWKERKGLLRQSGSRWRALVTVLIIVVMIGVLLPLQIGRDWLDTGWSLLAAFLFPLILVGITIPESFAGERERHTLSTLLASRLPDRAIFFGKLGLAIGYGWITTLLILLVSLMVVNVLFWEGQALFYAPAVILADVAFSFLMACLTASLGVLISLRSATTQGAQQALMFTLLIPLMALQIIPVLLFSVVPNGREIFQQLIEETDFGTLMLVVVAVLVVVNVGLLLAAMARFKRARLILQ